MERCFECSAQARILADWANWQPYLYDRWKTQGYSSQKKGDVPEIRSQYAVASA